MSSRTTTLRRLAPLAAALALSCTAALANIGNDEDPVGELMGDLMFHADLMSALDALCPRSGQANDWRAVVQHLPAQARTPELQDLSRRLSVDASRSMVRASGGCATRNYAELYAETRRDFEALRERWAWYSI